MKKILAILTLLLLGATALRAQEYRYEVGPALGVSGYLGDVNDGNMYKHPGVAGGGLFRYLMNSRWNFKASLTYAGLSGDSNDIDRQLPHDEHYDFSSSVFDLGVSAEFNFLNFGMGARYKRYKRFTPYMTVGLGAAIGVTSGETNFSMVMPLGIGFKYKLKERLNLGFEFTMRKAFGDKLDGLTDLNGVNHGFAKNTDWYSVAVFTVTYEFSKRCTKCHYVE